MTDHGADLLIRVGVVHTLVPGQAPQRRWRCAATGSPPCPRTRTASTTW
ncbi:hypothetical protein [Streptomyces sasae]|nr:hypothetical protein [Streptomyces sasae]